MYLRIFEEKNAQWSHISIATAWLDVDDYPKIVAAADLGICLHYSSSGYDLPMKVVDMFAAQTPCLAFKYLCIEELVEDGRNGRVFSSEEELSEQLFDTLKGFKGKETTDTLKKWTANLKDFGKEDWDSQWEKVVKDKIL